MIANTVDSRRFSRISPRRSDDAPIIFHRQQDRGHGTRRGQRQADAACRGRDDLFQLHHGARTCMTYQNRIPATSRALWLIAICS